MKQGEGPINPLTEEVSRRHRGVSEQRHPLRGIISSFSIRSGFFAVSFFSPVNLVYFILIGFENHSHYLLRHYWFFSPSSILFDIDQGVLP